MTDNSVHFVQGKMIDPAPPPPNTVGPLAWIRANLFSSIGSSLMTLIIAGIVIWVIPGLYSYLIGTAVWSASNGEVCRVQGTGACWPFISYWLPYFTFAFYPLEQRWRVVVTVLLGLAILTVMLWPGSKYRNNAFFLFFFIYPVIAFILLYGAPSMGLEVVDTDLWGGIFVTLLVALVGIVFSLPLGILLALGRRSDMPIVKMFCVIIIEFVRGVPFITILFMAKHIMPLMIPKQFEPNPFLLPLIGTAFFSAAYMAETVRGGLQAMPKGQTEGAQAVGLNYWKTMYLVVLPQALTYIIPSIVANFISLFQDTTLVASVGMFDFLKTIETARSDPSWAGPSVSVTGYIFAAIVYFICCFGMSRYAQNMENRISSARKR